MVAAIEAVFNNLGAAESRFESRLILCAGGDDIAASGDPGAQTRP